MRKYFKALNLVLNKTTCYLKHLEHAAIVFTSYIRISTKYEYSASNIADVL